ncbi:MAG: dihydroorotase [Candidatus Omnitrophica bacterium]|nr:dihydroorotase [Candidatus Omnitrophota bacterium]
MTPARYLIKNGRVIDPANKIDGLFDILISDGKIEKVGVSLDEKCDKTIDAKDKIIIPGLVDMHTHLREPGREDKETVASGTRAAVRGGYTMIACMPNTEPAVDNPKTVKLLKDIIKKDALCGVAIVGAITLSRAGKKLADFTGMKKAGAIAVSDDGSSVEDKDLMLEAMRGAKSGGMLVIDHCEDTKLSAFGMVNKSLISTKMGLKGITRASEYEMVRREIGLAEKCGGHIHIAHVSCGESVDIIRKAKKRGVKVTAETAPHYFALTEECCATYDTNTKMNPPLRSKEDVEAIKKGLSDGTIDAIATDHAPHTDSEKDVEFDLAPFGIIGLETALGLALAELVDKKTLSWSALVEKMSINPAKILGLAGTGLKKGAPADITVIDPNREYVYKKDSIESRSKNSPFIDWSLKGRVTDVFVGGDLVMESESIKART